MDERVQELEALVRAQLRLEEAMYRFSLESSWPTEAHELLAQYEKTWGVTLEGS